MPIYNAIADTWIYNGSDTDKNTNYGASERVNIGTYYYAFFKFQTITIPPEKRIASVILKFYSYSGNSVPTATVLTPNKILADWFEMQLTYNNRPPTQGYGDTYSITIPYPKALVSLDITNVVKNDIENINLNGLNFVSTKTLIADSRETGSGAYLDVTFVDAPPAPPQPLFPFFSIVDRGSVVRFQWQQSFLGAESEIIYNDGTDHTISIPNSNTYYDMPANTLPEKQISWKVRSRDPNTSWTDFSQDITFIAGSKAPTPTISTTAIQTGNPTINWTSTGQVKYRLKLKEGSTVVEQIETQSQATSYTIKTLLTNATAYTIELEVAGDNGLWSSVATKNITSNFLLPTNPTWTLTANNGHGDITIASGANSEYHQVLKLINGTYEVIKDNIPLNATLSIYELISGTLETLKIRTFRTNGGYLDTPTKTVQVTVPHCLIFDGDTTEIQCVFSPDRAARLENKNEVMYFAGREKAVILTGEHTQVSFDYSFEFFDSSSVAELENIVRERKKVLIRDNRGRLTWATICGIERRDNNLSTSVKLSNVYEVQR